METRYQEERLVDVMNYFADGFKPPKGRRIVKVEHFLDPHTGVVVFKLYVEPDPDPAEKP